jgi:Asp-tRNA(Asn)/Glu-tRNA(Gln) amidotransferase C subunit
MSDEFNKKIKKLKQQLQKTEKEKEKLQDEVDSLWAMMDEMTKSDIENWSHLLDQLEADTAVRALMVTKKKADA